MAAQQATPRVNRWTRINLILGVVTAVLLALHLWPRQVMAPTRLTSLDAGTISTIRIEHGERLQIALQRSADGWELTHPGQARARSHRVEQLLAIARATVERTLPSRNDLAQYGLAEPTVVLVLDEVRVAFGDRDPAQRSRYVLLDNRVLVIDDVYFNLLTLPPRHFTGD